MIKVYIMSVHNEKGLQTHKFGNREQMCASVLVIVILFPAISPVTSRVEGTCSI